MVRWNLNAILSWVDSHIIDYPTAMNLNYNWSPGCATQFTVYNLLFTQAPIPVCLDGTIIDSSTILVTMYYCGYVVV